MAGVLADALIWTRRGIPQADRTGARGLRISSWGIALMVLGVIPLAADVAVRTYGAAASPILDRIGGLLAFPGILLFLVGLAYLTLADRCQALRDWSQHRRIYRDLGPLWHSLHEVFPEGALPTGSRRRGGSRPSLRGRPSAGPSAGSSNVATDSSASARTSSPDRSLPTPI